MNDNYRYKASLASHDLRKNLCVCVCVEVPGPVRGVFHQYYVVVRMLRGVLPWPPSFP